MLDANPGLSPTTLAERLKRLAEDDLAERIEVRRGRQSVVYRLTERGREVEPVVDALYRFGGAMLDTIPLSLARISYALDAAVRRAGDAVFELLRAELRLVVDGVAIDLRLAPGMLVVAEGLDDPDAVATMDRLAFLALVGGSAPEGVAVEGDGLVFEVLRAVLSGGQP